MEDVFRPRRSDGLVSPRPTDDLLSDRVRRLDTERFKPFDRGSLAPLTGPDGAQGTRPALSFGKSTLPTTWTSWDDRPWHTPKQGYLLPRENLVGELSRERFPGIVLERSKTVDATGPPRSLEILNQSNGVPYADAVRGFLVGPDQRIVGEYARSPDGRYVLDLPAGKDVGAGRYQIRIVVDGDKGVAIRTISLRAEERAGLGPESRGAPDKLAVYVTEEPLKQQFSRTTFDKTLAGEKFLGARTEEIDRALVHYREAYEGLDLRSSYELRWKTTYNYARSLHDAVIWHRYDYGPDARRLFEKLIDEHRASSSRWGFWHPRLTDIGIKEADLVASLRDLEALELQRLYTSYFLEHAKTDLGQLSTSLLSFVRTFLSDEQAFSRRLQITRVELMEKLETLKAALNKFELPALVELEDGDFLVKNIEPAPPARVTSAEDVFERALPPGRRIDRALSELQKP